LEPRGDEQDQLEDDTKKCHPQHNERVPPVLRPQCNVEAQTGKQEEEYGSVRGLSEVHLPPLHPPLKDFHVGLHAQKRYPMESKKGRIETIVRN
jgi:hypothetical protein